MIKVSVVGATGYTGRELLQWLRRHPSVKVVHITSESSPGQPLAKAHPSMRGVYDLRLEKFNPKVLAKTSDMAFFALPHGVGSQSISDFVKLGKRAIDLSADFRLHDVKTYQRWYKVKHASPALLKKAIYGLPEFFRRKIPTAPIVANPGCYATAIALAVMPLLKHKIVDTTSLVVDAKSGVSGAGKKMDSMYHFSEATENFQAYAVAKHRHTPEIEQTLKDATRRSIKLTFVPHLVPMNRGILAVTYGRLKKKMTAMQVRRLYEKEYGNEAFIRLLPEGLWPQTRHTVMTNFCDINLTVDPRTGRVIVMSALDNLVKGAAGQAIQNMNLMFGFPEQTGLL